MSKTKLGRSMDKFKQENVRRIADINAEKVERETTKAAKKAESISIRKEIKPSNTSRIGKFFASIIYGHRRTKETINEIIKQINELDQAIMNLEFQIDSYKNSKNKLEKEIYSENKTLFDNVDENITNLECCVINYCETINKTLEKTKVKQKNTEFKTELQENIKKGLDLKSKRLCKNIPLLIAS